MDWCKVTNNQTKILIYIYLNKLNITDKTILIIIISVTFFGVLFFILVRNALKRKLDFLVEEEKKKKSDNLD